MPAWPLAEQCFEEQVGEQNGSEPAMTPEADVSGEGDLPEGQPGEDAAPKRMSKDPGFPTQSERDENCVDRTPYRSGCEDCVRGQGDGRAAPCIIT